MFVDPRLTNRPRLPGHDDLAAGAGGGDLAPHDAATPISGGSMSIPAIAIIFGIEPRLAIPMPAHAVQSMAMPRVSRSGGAEARHALAQQVVGRAVVGLPTVAEAAGDRAEDDRGAESSVAQPVQQVEPPVALHAEDEVELLLRSCRRAVWLISSPAQWSNTSTRAWPARTLADDGADRVAVGEVDLVPVRRASGVADRGDGVGGSLRPFEAGQLALDERRGCPLAAWR